MAFQCRRCPDRIAEGQIAHIVGSIFVCQNCLRDGEEGFRDDGETVTHRVARQTIIAGKPLAPRLTGRQLTVFLLAAQGHVWRGAQRVHVHDPDTGQTTDSGSVIGVLRDLGLCQWEPVSNVGRDIGDPTAYLRLTPLGELFHQSLTKEP